MQFSLPHALLVRLRNLRAQRAHPDDVEQSEDAFLLDPGLGPALYLTSTGRVLVDGRSWDETPLREATDDEAISALVVGALKTGLDELLALVPSPPAGANPCARCHGRRWELLGADLHGKPMEIVCTVCRGRGWIGPA